MSVAAHEVLHLVGLVTGLSRIGGTGPDGRDRRFVPMWGGVTVQERD